MRRTARRSETADWVREKGDAAGGRELRRIWEKAAPVDTEAKAPTDIVCEHAEPHSIASIPPRPWAYGNFLLIGHASVIGAADGGGKGSLAVAIALSMITGRELLGERVWRTGPVAIITYEDDQIEWRRRIAAACLYYRLDYADLIPRIHFIHRPGSRICLAAPSKDGTVFPDGAAIIAHLKRIGAALLIVDPFNHAHALEDSNNNVLIAQVAGETSRIANESRTAVLALHHLRKGANGSSDDLMGATMLRATFRAARILSRMTEDQAEELGLPRDRAWRYSCISGAKDNYAPPPRRATWYCLESVALGNPDPDYPDGDNVQVTTIWTPPSLFADLRLDTIDRIFDVIRQGPGEGERYSPDVRAENWIGQPIAEISGKADNEAKAIAAAWMDTEVLIKGKYRSPSLRRMRTCVTLNDVKAAEILKPLHRQPEVAE